VNGISGPPIVANRSTTEILLQYMRSLLARSGGSRQVKLPQGRILIPGVVTHATNVVEHPELVADRILVARGRRLGVATEVERARRAAARCKFPYTVANGRQPLPGELSYALRAGD